ncbi:hypothetical protein LTR94_030657, partial [Friedmanniomyces endolithicus]
MMAPFRGQLERAKAVPKVPEWERIVTEMQIVAERMVREAALDDGAGQGSMTVSSPSITNLKSTKGASARERAAWGFVAPALIAIGLFFALPVIEALLLSLTDFDIYALAELDNLRFVGLQNYERLLTNPLFWGAMKNTLTFAVLGVPL